MTDAPSWTDADWDDEDEDRQATAYHEAGHSVIAVLLGAKVRYATLDSEQPGHLGEVEIHWPRRVANTPSPDPLRTMLAGPVAEALYRDMPWEEVARGPGAQDLRQAFALAATYGWPNPKILHWMRIEGDRLSEFFTRDAVWAAVSAVADLLLAHATLEHEELAQEVRTWIPTGLP